MSNTEEKSKEATQQVFPTTISQNQRFTLVQLISSSQNAVVQGADERLKLKRFKQGFGLEPIFAASKESGAVNTAMALGKKTAAFLLTLENVEFFLNVLMERLPLSGPQALVLEPLIDALNDAKGRPDMGALPEAYELFDASVESWAAPSKTVG